MDPDAARSSPAPWTITIPGRRDSIESQKEEQKEKKQAFRKMYLAAVASLTFGISMGMASAYSATATENMKRPGSSISPSGNEVSWIGSLVAVGAFIGGIAAGYLSNRFGRKGALLLSSIPFLVGWLFIAYAPTITFIYIGRVITGFCVGVVCVTTPAYLVEISTPEVRGLLGASFQLFVVIGVLAVAILGSFLSWKWLAVASAIMSIIALAAMSFMPESPRWLVSRGKYHEAVSSVSYLQGEYLNASAECVAIDEDLRQHTHGNFSLEEFLKPSVFKPALISAGLVFFQQASGSNAILFYTVDIFKQAGSSMDPNDATIVVDAVLVLATAVSSVLMDKAGRRVLLLASAAGMGLSLSALGGYDFAAHNHPNFAESHGWIPLVCIVFYIIAFSLGFGPIPWLVMAEITPVKFRSIICGAATALCWAFVFVVTKTFDTLDMKLHDYGAYWLYAGLNFVGCIFAWFCVPETKGKSFEEIQDFFCSKPPKDDTGIKHREMS